MKRKMTIYTMQWAALMTAGFFWGACSRGAGEAEQPAVPITIYSQANANGMTGEGTADRCRLFFWKEADFKEWLDGTEASLYFACKPDEAIDHYRYAGGIAYNTGQQYPADGTYLYATGYAPVAALELNESGEVLTVKADYQKGQTDFLSCDGKRKHRGSTDDPFAQEEHELLFRHLIARLRFVGIRDEVMYNRIGVNNVKVTVQGGDFAVPTSFKKQVKTPLNFEQDTIYSTYVASGLKTIELDPIAGGEEMIPATQDGRTLGEYYVLQEGSTGGYNPFVKEEREGTISLTLDIEADLYYLTGDTGTPIFYTRKQWQNVSVKIESRTGDVMLPGYEYVVRIIFNNESIILQGMQKGWEDGGMHYLPVRPTENT